MVMNAAGWHQPERFNGGIHSAGGEQPVVAHAEPSANRFRAERDLDAVLEHEGRGRHLEHSEVGFHSRSLLVPATNARMPSLDVGWDGCKLICKKRFG